MIWFGMKWLKNKYANIYSACFLSDSIDDNMQVKITDNALARDLFPMDYHCLGDNENRPVRWMALESLLNNDFSSASDVVRAAAHLVSTAFLFGSERQTIKNRDDVGNDEVWREGWSAASPTLLIFLSQDSRAARWTRSGSLIHP